jgi:hypothetical protein
MSLGTYVVSGDAITVAAAPTLVLINPPAGGATGRGIEILRAYASQRANATSAQQGIALGSKVTAFPTLTSATPAKVAPHDDISVIVGGTAGAAGTCGINASAEGAGAYTAVVSDNFNVLNGYLWVPTPAETFVYMPGSTSAFALKFTSTPGTLTSWSFGVVYREL